MKRTGFSAYILISIIVTALVFSLSGCKEGESLFEKAPDKDSPLQQLIKDMPEEAQAILINQPTEKQRKDYSPGERIVLEESNESFLLIVTDGVEEITIWELEFNGVDLARKSSVFTNYNPSDEYVLEVVALRPEGAPRFQLSLTSDEGESVYYIAYDGKDGTPDIEYINKKK